MLKNFVLTHISVKNNRLNGLGYPMYGLPSVGNGNRFWIPLPPNSIFSDTLTLQIPPKSIPLPLPNTWVLLGIH